MDLEAGLCALETTCEFNRQSDVRAAAALGCRIRLQYLGRRQFSFEPVSRRGAGALNCDYLSFKLMDSAVSRPDSRLP